MVITFNYNVQKEGYTLLKVQFNSELELRKKYCFVKKKLIILILMYNYKFTEFCSLIVQLHSLNTRDREIDKYHLCWLFYLILIIFCHILEVTLRQNESFTLFWFVGWRNWHPSKKLTPFILTLQFLVCLN